MSMRMCSLSRSVHDAHKRNTALNNTHCSSSQEFDDMSNTLRTVALTADTTTAARMAHATHLPICVLMASITPLSLRSARTLFPFPSAPVVSEHGRPMAPPHRRRCPSGRYANHLSKNNGRKVKSPLGKTSKLCSRTGAGEGNRTLDIQLGKQHGLQTNQSAARKTASAERARDQRVISGLQNTGSHADKSLWRE